MTSTTEPRRMSRDGDAPVHARDGRMPRPVRWALGFTVAGLLVGALYLVAVRGEALLVDLATFGSRLWCF